MRHTGQIIRAAAALLIVVTASPAAAQTPPDAASNLLVSPAWLSAHLDDPRVAIISVGTHHDVFARGHIAGAAFLEHRTTLQPEGHRLLDARALADVLSWAGADDNKRIVLYGDEPMVVGWLFTAIASLGHGDHVALLDGNLKSWTAAGYPVATGPSSPPRGRLTSRTAPDFVVDAAWVRDHLTDPAISLVDVRSDREWQQGMIPNAHPLLWRDLFSDLDGGKFKTAEQIRELFGRAGVTEGRTAVTYCAVGMRASLAYFAARVAGIPARLYRGSWSDWSSRPGYPAAPRR